MNEYVEVTKVLSAYVQIYNMNIMIIGYVISCCNTRAFPGVATYATYRSFVVEIGNVQCSNLQCNQIGRTSSCAHIQQLLNC